MDVLEVAGVLIESHGARFLATLGLPEGWRDRLRKAARRGALLHDFGKANHQSQRLVRQGPDPPQAFRHEWLSLFILLRFPELDRWLFPDGADLIRHAALFAVAGHHLELGDGRTLVGRDGSGDHEVRLLTGHADVEALLQEAAGRLGLPVPPPRLANLTIDLLSDDPLAEAQPWLRHAKAWWDGEASKPEKRFVALVKALVIAADVAGSAIPRAGIEAAGWVTEVLHRTCQAGDIDRLAAGSLRGHPRRPFQDDAATAPARIVLIRAGCGSGKTTSAYLWAARHAAGRKLFFCYPTTGTATEGYADYVLPDEIDARLIHSRAEVDLENLLGSPDDPHDPQLQIESLASWDVPLVVCTADTVLGLIQNTRRGLFSLPAIANGAFVFDEIHAYDDRLFGALLRFLDAFRTAPVLLMTASLPEPQLKALRAIADELGQTITEIQGPAELEGIRRYRLRLVGEDDAWAEAGATLAGGSKVLWVVNTVDRAVSIGQEALRRGLGPVLPYHSRYRYVDRLGKHRAVIEAFKREGPALAITTQVCEVSLDLSAHLLVTDLAPIPAAIQRLGRLNRRVTVDQPGDPRAALILEPETALPYNRAELERCRKWLAKLGAHPVSQADLARAFLEVAPEASDIQRVRSAWLDGGPFSAPAPLREAGTTIPVIRAEDAPGAREDRGQVVRLAIPMPLGPVREEIGTWTRLGVARVATSDRIDYSETWGARWRR
jgi:CRISPR-associated endonuclease/helicase Cas3